MNPLAARLRTLIVASLVLSAAPALAGAAQASSGAPDLVVLEVHQAPADARPGEPVQYAARVANVGDARAGSFVVIFQTETRWLGGEYLVGLGAGETALVTATENATAPRGNTTVRVEVDRWLQVDESDESNNVLLATFEYGGEAGPDLRFDSIDVNPASARIGDWVRTKARFTNAADRPAGEFWVSFHDDLSREERAWYVRGLAAGETLEVVFSHQTTVAGDGTISVIADLYGNLEERDGSNNGGWAGYNVSGPSGPDLAVLRMWTDPATPEDGRAVSIYAEVANLGDEATPETTARWTYDGWSGPDLWFPSLAAGERTTYGTSVYYAEEGSRTATLFVDSTSSIAETDEDNNVGVLHYEVTPSPLADLVVAHMILDGSSIEGETQRIVAVLRNTGHGDAGASRVRFVLDNVHDLGAFEVPPIAAGGEARVAIEWVAEVGIHRIRAFADAENAVAESAEWNNEMELYFGISPRPRHADLQVRILAVEKSSIMTDVGSVTNSLGPVKIVVEVCNVGGAKFHGGGLTVHARAVAAGLQTLDAIADVRLEALEAEACETHTYQWTRERPAAGDVEIHARGYSTAWGEVNPENNQDMKRTFLFAGNTGLGGVILP